MFWTGAAPVRPGILERASMPVRPRSQAKATTSSQTVPERAVIWVKVPKEPSRDTESLAPVFTGLALLLSTLRSTSLRLRERQQPPTDSRGRLFLESASMSMPLRALLIMTPGKPSSFAMVLAPPPRMKIGRFFSRANLWAALISSGSSISMTYLAGPPSRIVVRFLSKTFSKIFIFLLYHILDNRGREGGGL